MATLPWKVYMDGECVATMKCLKTAAAVVQVIGPYAQIRNKDCGRRILFEWWPRAWPLDTEARQAAFRTELMRLRKAYAKKVA